MKKRYGQNRPNPPLVKTKVRKLGIIESAIQAQKASAQSPGSRSL